MNSESTTRRVSDGIRIAIAGGGTGGHISPAVALIEELRSRLRVDAIWIGSRDGFERQAAENLGLPFHAIRTGKLRRYASPQTLVDVVRVPWGAAQARSILREWRPDVLFSSGGFVSVPSVAAARSLRIPALTHEQTAYIGLATRINARFCQTVALSFDRSREFLPDNHTRIVVTGNPVRRIVMNGDASAARTHYALPNDRPLLYFTGGAQGSRALNRVVFDSLYELLGYVALVHQVGPADIHPDLNEANRLRDDLPVDLRCRYRPVERTTSEIGNLYAAAALAAGRAGAGTVNELAALSLPAILIPLPGAEEQRQNALFLVERGTARLIPQDELTPQSLVTAVAEIVSDPGTLARMRSTEPDLRPLHAAEKIADEILRLLRDPDASGTESDVNRFTD